MGFMGMPVRLRKTNLMLPKLAREQTLRVLCPRLGCHGAAIVTVQQVEGQLPDFPVGQKRKCDVCGEWMTIRAHFNLFGVIPE